jgi:predicted TIM-barrel fold metal-dependent hydrolase
LIKEYDMILASGHISPRETFALVEGALAMGISKLIVTHALPHSFEQTLSLEEQQRLGKMGAFIEYVYVGFLPNEFRDDPQHLVKVIRGVGAEHCIISTDLGQYNNPSPAEGMRMFIALLLKNGLTENEIELMAKVNPAKLLGLD